MLGFAPLSLVTVQLWAAQELQVIDSITGQAASDRPIGWNDTDALNLKPLAKALSRFLRNINSAPPLTLAVTGRWGSGKSSLMRLLQEDLESRGTRTVWFNAWHHRQEEHLFAALMEAIRIQAVSRFWQAGGIAFRSRLLWHRTAWLRPVLAILLLFAAIASATVYLGLGDQRHMYFQRLSQWVHTPITTILAPVTPEAAFEWLSDIPLMGPVLVLLGGIFLWLMRLKLVAFPTSPAALLATLSSRARLRDFRDRLDFRHEFGEALSEVATALRSPTNAGLVVLIDDLDRCQPEDVLKILEAVNFIVSSGPCIVVLGLDRHQVEHTIGLGFERLVDGLSDEELDLATGEEGNESARRRAFARLYLEKLINIEVPVPAMNRHAALSLLGATAAADTPPPTEPAEWVGSFKRRLGSGLGAARVAVFALLVGAVALSFVQHVGVERSFEETATATVEAPVREPPVAAAPADPPAAEEAPESEVTPAELEPFPVPATLREPGPEELPARIEWLYWVASLLTVLVLALWCVAILLRRRQAIHRDSPQFARALAAVEPLLRTRYATPRGIKRWQNRMRLAAELLRPEGHEVDAVDHLLHWLSRRLKRSWVPDEWFHSVEETKPSEPALILLGAIEATDQGALSDDPADTLKRWEDSPTVGTVAGDAAYPTAAAWAKVTAAYRRDFANGHDAWPDADDVRLYRSAMTSLAAEA